MFGYVRIRKPELKIKDYECYHAFYCGLCRCLKERHGLLGQLSLTYDMTFLVILLSSVYDLPVKREEYHCVVHPVKRHPMIGTEASAYAADLNVLFSYYHFWDDQIDEPSIRSAMGVRLYHRKCRRIAEKYPRQSKALKRELRKLSLLEQKQCREMDQLADCFGRLLAELFVWKEDPLKSFLWDLGYYLGRFIYIMDAYDDLAEDAKKGRFNPLLQKKNSDFLRQEVNERLLNEISAASAAFEKLPCLEYRDILRNILYAGVWNRFDMMEIPQEEKQRGKRRGSV